MFEKLFFLKQGREWWAWRILEHMGEMRKYILLLPNLVLLEQNHVSQFVALLHSDIGDYVEHYSTNSLTDKPL